MNDRLRRQQDVMALGGFTIDLLRGELFDPAGQRVKLRRQSLAVLLELARNAGDVLGRDHLLRAVWHNVFVTDDSLVQCIGEIRRTLGAELAKALRTVPRRGYVLESCMPVLQAIPSVTPAGHAAGSRGPGLLTGPPGLPFVGRQAELDLLVASARRDMAQGCVVLISGEPGIGKSRLVNEALQVISTDGATAFSLKCHEIEAGVAYGALSRLADGLVSCAGDEALRSLDAVSRAELAALAPWCTARLEPMAPLDTSQASLRPVRLRAAVVALCLALSARQRLILCIDDAHWLDEASAVALFAVAESASRAPLSLWATMRRDEIVRSPNAAKLVHALQQLPHTLSLELSRLKPEHVADIVARAPGRRPIDDRRVQWLVRESAGNPFYLRELMQANGEAAAPGEPSADPSDVPPVLPAGILDAVLHRAGHLPRAARQLLDAAAVLEQGAAFDVLCAVARQARHVALDALEILLSTGWLVEDRDRGRYPFAHDKLQETIQASLVGARRRSLHGRAARALLAEAVRRRTPPEHAVVAGHAQRAGQSSLAIEQFALAGDAARRMFELRRAEALYTRALSFDQDLEGASATAGAQLALLEKRGAVRSMLGVAAEAEADLRRAIALVQARSHVEGAITPGLDGAAGTALMGLHIELGVMLQRHHRLEDALSALDRALRLASAAGDADAIAAARCWMGDVEWMRERNHSARSHFEAVLGAGEPASPVVEALRTKALFGLAQCAGMDARPALADRLLDQALARARTPAELQFECAWNVLKGWIRVGGHGMAEPEAARMYFERCQALSEKTDLFWYSVPCHIGIGVVHAMLRRFDAAIERFESVLSLPADAHNDRWRMSAGVWLASCHLDRGDPAAALETALRAQRALGESGPFMFAAMLPALITTARVRLGRAGECDDPLPLIEHARRNEIGYVVMAGLLARAEWLCAREDMPRLRQCADELLSEATERGLHQARDLVTGWHARAGLPA